MNWTLLTATFDDFNSLINLNTFLVRLLLYFIAPYITCSIIHYFLPLRLAVLGELVSRYRHSPGSVDCFSAILLTFHCFMPFTRCKLHRVQKLLITLIPILALIALVLASLGWPSSLCRLFIFLIHTWFFALGDTCLSLIIFAPMSCFIDTNSTPAAQPFGSWFSNKI